MEGDFSYFSRRAQEEREAAMKALSGAARQAHLEMAERYEQMATATAPHRRVSGQDAISPA
jgi:hypothetical protein